MIGNASLPLAGILDNVNGLPTHALLVHFTVVVSTVGALAGLAYVLVPGFRRWLSLPLVALGAASIVLGLVTPSSGESLEARLPHEPLIEKHAELGDQMGTIMIAYGVLLIVTMLIVRYRSRPATEANASAPTAIDRVGAFPGEHLAGFGGQPQLAALLTILVLAGSIVSGIWIYRTGDAGAKSVWHDTPAAAAAPAGDDD